MSLHESRRSPARRIDDLKLLQGLLTQRLYVPEHDRRLLHALLAETPRQLRTTPRATRRRARRLRATGAARALWNSKSWPIRAVATADDALAQAELTVGETLVIPAAQAADAIVADTIVAAPSYSVAQQTVSYYVVRPGDTLSGIALAFYGNGN